ncbi:hypothetical protein SteCoe_19760 [Stentor coeruleus]|uniref:Uncharacterized protein n=1 Tax=Stentor coeruleus TaxID=5963 RepID=A0A1R2BTI7_9CILI|nr:hypothetical protein SteCoe_19760 [Stentor coeruleus]
MITLNSSRSAPFVYLRNTSMPIIVPHSLTKRKAQRIFSRNSSDEEKQAVEKLNDWEKQDKKLENFQSISEAKITLKKRIDKEDIVEEIKLKRKHKIKLPDINSHKLLPVIKSIKDRQSKKESEENFKERCRYLRLFEEDLNNTSKQLSKELSQIKHEKDTLREDCVKIKKILAIYIEETEKLKEALLQCENRPKVKISQEELAAWMSHRDLMREELKKREQGKVKVQDEISEEVLKRHQKLIELDGKSKDLREKLDIVKFTQIKHYQSLLKEGKDVGNEGIQWIVIALWNIGETVSVENFPSYLDGDAIHFILFVAQKNLEIEEILNKIINPSKKNLAPERMANRWNNIRERLTEVTKHMHSQKPEYSYNNKSQKVSIRWTNCMPHSESMVSRDQNEPTSYYENYVAKIKEMIASATESEIQRLTIECSLHGYEEAYKTNMKELIGAITGTETLDKHLAAINKHKRNLVGVLEGNRSANVGL